MNDTILCHDKEDAKRCIDNIGSQHIDDWDFLEDGKIRIHLNCKLTDWTEEGAENESRTS